MTGVDFGAASRAGPASSRVLVADSKDSTPANAAAAITALMNFSITAPVRWRKVTPFSPVAAALQSFGWDPVLA